jgi:hypothetical protein
MDLKGELFRFDGACKFPLAGRSESSSREADARTLRSGEKATASTSLLMAIEGLFPGPSGGRTDSSAETDATTLLSGEKVTALTQWR